MKSLMCTMALVLCLPAVAAAQILDTERFRPVPDPSGGVGLAGVGGDTPWEVDVALWIHGSRNPVVAVAEDGESAGEAWVEGRAGLRMQAGWNIGRRVRIAVDVPLTLHQAGVHPVDGGELPSGGIGDLRFLPRVTLVDPTKRPVGVALGVPISFPTGRKEALLGDPGPSVQPRASIEGRIALAKDPRLRFAVGGDVGWRFRPASDFAGFASGGEFTFAVGARWMPSDRFRLGTEIVAAIGAGANARQAEWLSWARLGLGPAGRVELQGGLGLGLGPGVGTPEGRVFVSVRTRIDPRPRVPYVAVVESAPEPSSPGEPGFSPPIPGQTAGEGWGLRLIDRSAELRTRVTFDTDSDRMDRVGRAEVDRIARWLVEHPKVHRVAVIGHADPRGSHAHNDPLSERRARAVRNYLIGSGVKADRLVSSGRGEREPSGAGLSGDRRVEFVILEVGTANKPESSNDSRRGSGRR